MKAHNLLAHTLVLMLGTVVQPSPVGISEAGGYSLMIAIHNNVPEDTELITTIKKLFTEASEFLYNATRHQVYFQEVTISLPPTWSEKPEYSNCIQDNFESAQFRVKEDYDDEPYTDQPEGCGRQGRFVKLSPKYLATLEDTVNQFGIPERRIVHEWAHFRYGVYDEKPDDQYPGSYPYYRSNRKLLPTLCQASLADFGASQTEEDICEPKKETDQNCNFHIEEDYVTSRASIMYSTTIKALDSFCDDSNELKHNPESPTPQNIQCRGKSTWTVISSHEDFKHINPPLLVDTSPHFRVTRATGGKGRSVLLLDISGSMNGLPMKLLHECASHAVLNQIPDDSYVGIVAFGTRPRVLKQMTLVNNATRQDLASKLPKAADGGGTGIGRGLMESLSVLKGPKGTDPIEGGVILLITDGEETDEPKIETVMPSLVDAKVIVHVIAYGAKADILMEKLARETGGHVALFTDIYNVKADNADLVNKIAEAVTVHSDVELEPVKVKSANFHMVEQTLVVPVELENDLGRNTYFKVTGSDLSTVDAKLTTPSKLTLDRHSNDYRNTKSEIVFWFQEAESGLYQVTVLNHGNEVELRLSVESEARDPKERPVRVRTWIGDSEVVYPTLPKVYAQVYKGDLPVLNAYVTADVIGPDIKTTFLLQDNGAEPDAIRDDGCYTGYVSNINGNNRYQVVSHVKNTGKSRVKRRTKSFKINRRKRAGDETQKLDDSEENDPLLIFERVAEAGVFRVSGWAPGDLLPPSTVSDLRVVSVDNEVVTLSWTSPGDDLTEGNATWLDLRGSTNFTSILSNFEEQESMAENLVNGSLIPLPAGEIQSIQLLISEGLRQLQYLENNTSDTYYFALRAFDETNNTAEPSNIARALFLKEEPPEITESPTTSDSPTAIITDSDEPLDHAEPETVEGKQTGNAASIIGGILGVLLGVAVLLALVYCLIKRSGAYNAVSMTESV